MRRNRLMNGSRLVVAALTGLLLGSQRPSVAAANNDPTVGRSGTQFIVNGQTLYLAHANQYYLWYKPAVMVDEILNDAVAMGLTGIRLFAFCEAQSKDGFCFQPAPGQYDDATFQKLDYVVYRAGQLGLRLILPLVNNWDDGFGGMRQYVNWVKHNYREEIPPDLLGLDWLETVNVNTLTPGTPDYELYQRYHDVFYTSPHARQWYQQYVEAVLNRVNTYTGLPYKHDPTIFLWELANEPRAHSDPSGNTLGAWVKEMATFVKLRDPNHLLSTGEEGWYNQPGNPDWKYDGSLGVDYVAHHQVPGIDACSFHLLPNDNAMDEAIALQWVTDHVNDCRHLVGKPAYAGEFGWKVDRTTVSIETLLHTFAVDPEGWSADWGYTPASPTQVSQPSFDVAGALAYQTAGPIGPGGATPDAGGAKFYPDPGWDASGFDWLSARVMVPSGAPADLVADLYTASGDQWQWADGPDVPLVPGQWAEVVMPTNSVADPTAVRKTGIRLSAPTTPYDGVVYYDAVVGIQGSVQSAEEQMADRNRIYGDWAEAMQSADADDGGVWYLSGLQENGQLDPDTSHYAVFYPEDAGTSTVLNELAQGQTAKSAQPFTLWEACDAPGLGSAASAYSDATALTIDTAYVAQGTASCRLDFQPSGYQKAFWEFSPLDENWSGRPAVEFSVYSPVAGQSVSVAVSTGSDWTWHEIEPLPLEVGWNALRVDLQAATWKSAATGWQPTGTIAELSAVHRLSIGLFGYSQGGSLWVDGIKLTAPPRVVKLQQGPTAITWDGQDDEGRSGQSLEFSFQVRGPSGLSWTPWTTKTSVSLARLGQLLGAGARVFQVRARDADGVVSPVKGLLVVLPGRRGGKGRSR